MTNFLFDVDGTLTSPRHIMNKSFKQFFGTWTVFRQSWHEDKVFFVTGSDKEKTIQQVGLALWRCVDGSYQCCGNQLYERGRLKKESKWQMPVHLRLDLTILLEKSPWCKYSKKNIEERVGMANFSTIGRDATKRQRKRYYKWDQKMGEREKIVSCLSLRYPKLEFSIGGEISIDIYPKKKNKSQALLDMTGKTIFFGDRCDPNGNDFPISSKSDVCYHVSGWKETNKILRDKYNDYTGS